VIFICDLRFAICDLLNRRYHESAKNGIDERRDAEEEERSKALQPGLMMRLMPSFRIMVLKLMSRPTFKRVIFR